MKKKLRKIVVQGMPFWWKADWFYHSDDSRIIRVRIWGKDNKRGRLYVNLTSKLVEYLFYSSYPMPKDIGIIIEYALAHDWSPSIQGVPHWLEEDVDHLELEGFLLTDVGHLAETPGPLPRKILDPAYKAAWLKFYGLTDEEIRVVEGKI